MRTNRFPYAAVIAFVIGICLSIALTVSMVTRAEGPLPREVGTVEQAVDVKGYAPGDVTDATDRASQSSSTHVLP